MKILIYGNGYMGKIVKEIAENDNEVVGILDSLEEKVVICEEFDVIIDFSHHNATKKLLDFAVMKNKPVLIATTGHTDDELKYIQESSKNISILKITNTSYGITVMKHLIKEATKLLYDYDIEIVESHHNRKIDAPSGTAKTLAEEITKIRDLKILNSRDKKREKDELTIHSLRAGTIIGEHSVVFAGIDEIIEIKHTALSRKIFAVGAIKLAKKLLNLENGLYEEIEF